MRKKRIELLANISHDLRSPITTLQGYVEYLLSFEHLDEGGKDVIISVSDTGIGIDHKYLSRIFERTYMISDSRTPGEAKGCGLGLSIAAAIMEKHNGQIWCESTLGKGSTFYMSLPL